MIFLFIAITFIYPNILNKVIRCLPIFIQDNFPKDNKVDNAYWFEYGKRFLLALYLGLLLIYCISLENFPLFFASNSLSTTSLPFYILLFIFTILTLLSIGLTYRAAKEKIYQERTEKEQKLVQENLDNKAQSVNVIKNGRPELKEKGEKK